MLIRKMKMIYHGFKKKKKFTLHFKRLDELNFDEENSQFKFTYDLTFEFEYEPCIINIPSKYPKGKKNKNKNQLIQLS